MSIEITTDMLRWLASGERGVSSNTIFTHLTGVDALRGWPMDHPHDPDGLMRCEKLLNDCPALRLLLPRMADLGPAWAGLVSEWGALVSLVREEAPHWYDRIGSAPLAYERMREIIDAGLASR